MTIELNTREAYIAWRNDWRIIYKALSAQIHQRKQDIKLTARAGEYAGSLQSTLHYEKARATSLLEQYAEVKAYAAEQRNKLKAA